MKPFDSYVHDFLRASALSWVHAPDGQAAQLVESMVYEFLYSFVRDGSLSRRTYQQKKRLFLSLCLSSLIQEGAKINPKDARRLMDSQVHGIRLTSVQKKDLHAVLC